MKGKKVNIRDGGPIMKVINEAIRKQERERERDAKTTKLRRQLKVVSG